MQKKNFVFLFFVTVVLLFLFIGFPFLISEIYKKEFAFIANWKAHELLSYYGMIIAAIVGVAGVYYTVSVSTKQYREDARNRILPIVAINVINQVQPDPFIKGFNEDIYELKSKEELLIKLNGWLFFMLGKKNIAVWREPTKEYLEMINETEVIWKRGTIDERMYVRNSENTCLPLEIENVGNGIALRLCVGLFKEGAKPHYETEISLKQNEKRKIFIISKEQFADIHGHYILSVLFSDIAGNKYKQEFPLDFSLNEKERIVKSIDLSVTPRLIGRDDSSDKNE